MNWKVMSYNFQIKIDREVNPPIVEVTAPSVITEYWKPHRSSVRLFFQRAELEILLESKKFAIETPFGLAVPVTELFMKVFEDLEFNFLKVDLPQRILENFALFFESVNLYLKFLSSNEVLCGNCKLNDEEVTILIAASVPPLTECYKTLYTVFRVSSDG